MELLHGDICSNILKGFYSIANALPFGLVKSFYVNALAVELRQSGLQIEVNKIQAVFYKDEEIGKLSFDIVVNNFAKIFIARPR